MYNGIGLSTPRGSGTNGYVQRNIAHLRSHRVIPGQALANAPARLVNRQANPEILEHHRRRAIEVQCLQLRLSLEANENPLTEEEITEQVAKLRKDLVLALESGEVNPVFDGELDNTHYRTQQKNVENTKLARALGIRQNEHVEGEAFDREKQAEKRAKKKEEWEARRKVREARKEAYEKRESERLRRLREEANNESKRVIDAGRQWAADSQDPRDRFYHNRYRNGRQQESNYRRGGRETYNLAGRREHGDYYRGEGERSRSRQDHFPPTNQRHWPLEHPRDHQQRDLPGSSARQASKRQREISCTSSGRTDKRQRVDDDDCEEKGKEKKEGAESVAPVSSAANAGGERGESARGSTTPDRAADKPPAGGAQSPPVNQEEQVKVAPHGSDTPQKATPTVEGPKLAVAQADTNELDRSHEREGGKETEGDCHDRSDSEDMDSGSDMSDG